MKKNLKKLKLNKFAVAKLSNIQQIKGGSAPVPTVWSFCATNCCPDPIPVPFPDPIPVPTPEVPEF